MNPIAHEDLTATDRNLPDGIANNVRLKRYTAAMAEVAKDYDALGVTFVDLFAPSLALYDVSAKPLTINELHSNACAASRWLLVC